MTMPGIFSQVRPAANEHQLQVPDGMVKLAAHSAMQEIAQRVSRSGSVARSEVQDPDLLDGAIQAYTTVSVGQASAIGASRATATACWCSPAWAFSAAAWARAPSSRCTSGCPTRWKAPRRSAP